MVAKATNTVWTLRRMKALGVDIPTLTQFWRTEGRVHLEAQAPLWHSSLTVAQSRSLARAQRVAMAAITGRWHPSHSEQLQELALEPLDPRRTRSRHPVPPPGHVPPGSCEPDGEDEEDREAALPGAHVQDGQLPPVSGALPDKIAEF